jgi:hypothetical protein
MRFSVSPTFSIRLLAVWAAVLAILPFANLLLLTQVVELSSNQFISQTQTWLIFGLQSTFGAIFAASAYGLWQKHNWGRVLFLWACVIWFGVNIFSLFVPNIVALAAVQQPLTGSILKGTRFAVALFLPVWYLNRPVVKEIFATNSSTNPTKEETNFYDNHTETG